MNDEKEEGKIEGKETERDEAKKKAASNDDSNNRKPDGKEVEELNAETERINRAIAENENAKARQKLAGVSEAGTEEKPEFSDEEKASRKRIKAVADASGSSWGKNYE